MRTPEQQTTENDFVRKGFSSIFRQVQGRAISSHRKGHWFNPSIAHHLFNNLAAFCIILSGSCEPIFAYDSRIDGARWDPPARFNHAFQGELTVKRLPPSAVEGACSQLLGEAYTSGRKRRGCASWRPDPLRCTVITIDRPAYGTTPEAVFIHERGHCNGWGSDHEK